MIVNVEIGATTMGLQLGMPLYKIIVVDINALLKKETSMAFEIWNPYVVIFLDKYTLAKCTVYLVIFIELLCNAT